jgi:hypothetical protein
MLNIVWGFKNPPPPQFIGQWTRVNKFSYLGKYGMFYILSSPSAHKKTCILQALFQYL